MIPNLQNAPPAQGRLTLWLSLAVLFWLGLIAGSLWLARSQLDQAQGGSGSPLPELRSSLHLPYFSFARALRPGS